MKIKVFAALLLIGLVIIGYCISRNNDLSINDIEKYSKDISVKYTLRSKYGIRSYILNINNNSVVEATKSAANYKDDEFAEFNGYHATRIKGIRAIYDINNNVVLDLDSTAKKFGYTDYECYLLKYDEISKLLYAIICNSYTYHLLFVYNTNTRQIDEITRISPWYNNQLGLFCNSNANKVYVLNDENELCEYNFDTKEFKDLQIKPKCYSVADDKIIYLDKDGLCEYDIASATIKKLFGPRRHIIDLYVNKDATFVLTIEELLWHTEIFDRFLQWPTHNMNCLKMYELSTGKSKVLVDGNREHYVTSADFVE